MLTIRKKLAEQAAGGSSGKSSNRGKVARKLSFRSQLLASESNELGDVIPSMCAEGVGGV